MKKKNDDRMNNKLHSKKIKKITLSCTWQLTRIFTNGEIVFVSLVYVS